MHIRTQIRKRVQNILSREMQDHSVFHKRKYSINAASLPLVDMRFANENNSIVAIGENEPTVRTASLLIRVTRRGGDEVDDLLDEDAVLVETVLADDNSLAGLAHDWELVQTNFTDSGDGDKPLAELVLRYDVIYRATRGNVENARG
jgi:hypothetical protein